MQLPLNPGSMFNSVKDKLSDTGINGSPNTNSPSTSNNWWLTPPGMYDPKQKSSSYNKKFLDDTRSAIKELKDSSTEFFKYGIQEYRNNLDEDPTFLGFDIRVNFFNSPLFNNGNIIGLTGGNGSISLGRGPIDDFFRWGEKNNINDIIHRKQIYLDFIDQFRLFFNGVTKSDNDIGFKGFKSHYIKKVSGLDNLVEKVGSDSQKQFIDFGKDLIAISMYEDVSLNSGWMAMLYKTLSWSRLNGRSVLPDNLLRFDMDIVISEIRNFSRVIKAVDSNDYVVVRDNVSRYVYSLFECQLIFDNLSHQSSLDIGSSPTLNDSFDFGIKYKFSTYKMEKFSIDFTKTSIGTLGEIGNVQKKYTTLNNLIDDSGSKYDPKNKEKGDIITGNIKYEKYYESNGRVGNSKGGGIDNLRNSPNPLMKEKGFFEKKGQELVKLDKRTTIFAANNVIIRRAEKKGQELVKLAKRTAIFAANNVIIRRARLLSGAIDKIRNGVGLGRLAPPTNVYESNALGNPLSPGAPGQYLKDQLRGFVGQSLNDFLSVGNKQGGGSKLGNFKI
jgi:hypothetical protein